MLEEARHVRESVGEEGQHPSRGKNKIDMVMEASDVGSERVFDFLPGFLRATSLDSLGGV